MQKQIWGKIGLLCFALLSIAIILGNVLLVWVATGPRQLDFLTPYLERNLSPKDKLYQVKVGGTLLVWEGWSNPIDLRVRDVVVSTAGNVKFAEFPEISVGLNFTSLLLGRIALGSLAVRNADITLVLDDTKTLRLSQSGANDQAPALASLLGGMESSSDNSRSDAIEELLIRSATLTMNNSAGETLIRVPNMEFLLRRNHEGYAAEATLLLDSERGKANVKANGQWRRKDNTTRMRSEFSNLDPRWLSLFFDDAAKLAQADLPLSGKAEAKFDSERQPVRINFDVSAKEGTLKVEDLPEKLSIKKCAAKGYLADHLKSLTLIDSLCDFGDPILSAHGSAHFGENGTEIHLRGSAKELKTDDLYRYWPPALGPETRDWVLTRVKKGKVQEGTVTLNILPGDTELPALPEQSVAAVIQTQGVSVLYKPGHPKVEDVNATINLTGKSLKVQVADASILTEAKIRPGSEVYVEDLNLDNPDVAVSLNVAAPAVDIITLLSLPDIAIAQRGNFDSRVKGSGEGKVGIKLKMYSDRGPGADKVDVIADAQINGITQTGVLKRYDIENLTGTLKATNDELLLKGKGVVNRVPMTVDLAQRFGKEESTNLKADVPAMPIDALTRFGISPPAQLNGNASVDLVYHEKGVETQAELKMGLLASQLTVPELAYTKAKGVAAELTATIEQKKGEPIRVPTFSYEAPGFAGNGNALLASDGTLQALRFDKLRQGDSNLALAYGKENGRTRIEMKGDAFDFSNRVAQDGNFSTVDWRNLDLRAELGKVVLKDGRQLHNVKATLDCGPVQCLRGALSGTAGSGKPFSFTLNTTGNMRKLSGSAADTGALIKALGIYSNMVGGEMKLEGSGAVGSAMEGNLEVGEHSLQNAPILTKLLTVASLTGIVDTLKGDGIGFTKLTAPYSFKEDVITLKEAKSYGPALGLTADGLLNLRKGQMDIDGTVVPSYTLNSLVEKVPLIGTVLTGGKGQGVFATRYSLKGAVGDPVVTLNPLSMLTPGFTRNIFNIFNRPPPKDLKENSPAAPDAVQRAPEITSEKPQTAPIMK